MYSLKPPMSLTGAMLIPRRYALFISHAWDYHSEYDGLVNLLNSDSSFFWENLSVPKDKPLRTLWNYQNLTGS